MTTIVDLGRGVSQTYCALPRYRYVVRKGTHTDAPKLQQAWQNMGTGEILWRNIETVVVNDEEFYQK